MRARTVLLLLSSAAVLSTGCAHRYPVRAGGAREAVAGLPQDFLSADEPLPPGTQVRWDFGDGATFEGERASHAWMRAGEYRLQLKVTDGKGVRTDEAKVVVQRRPPATAVPAAARTALVFDRFFARLVKHVAVAERLAGSDRVRRLLESLEALLGLDPTRPEQVLAAGIDPEKGLALAWLPDDAGTWLVVGIFDERAAMEAARSSLGKRTQVSFSPGPSGSTIAQVGKAQLVFVTSGGYLYVHLAGDDATPPKMEAVVGCAPQGLYADPLFASARARVEGEDALLFVRGSELPNHQAISGDAAILRAHATAFVAALTNRESELTLQARMGFDSEGEAVLARALLASPRVELDAKAPAGAVGYLSLSLGAQALSGWIKQGDHQKLDRALAQTGLEDLAPLASGGAALAVYLDLAALFREIAGEAGASKVKIVAALSLTDPQAARGKLEAAASAGKLQSAGPSRWTTTTKGESALTVLEGGAAYFGHQSLLEAALEPGPNTRRLAEALRATLPPDALLAGHQTLFVDVAGIIDQLRHPPREATALDGPKQMQLTMLMAAMLEESPQLQPLLPMKDFYLDVSKDGSALTARARLRFR